MEIIKCERCQTRFRVSRDLIKETGTAVRCSNCQNVFTVFRTMPEEEYGPEDLDRRLERLLDDGEDDGGQSFQAGAGAGRPALRARPPRPAKTNPISLITGDGDNFIVAGDTARRAAAPPPPPPPPPSPAPSPPWAAPPPPSPAPASPAPGPPWAAPPPPSPAPASPAPRPPWAAPPPPPAAAQSWPPMAWPPPPPNGEADLGLGVDPLSPSPPGQPPGGPPIGPGQPWPPPGPQGQPGAGPYPQPGYDQPQAYPQAYQSPLRTKGGQAFSKRQKILFLVLSILAAFFVISTLFMNMGADSPPPLPPKAASPEAGAAAANAGEALARPPQADVLNLIFLKEQNTHHYVTHPEAGQLLVIVGRIRNGYDKPISHIRVKGSLKSADDQILSERQVFAGNYLSEDVLKSLSMREILARLSLRGGENGSNLNIQPGQDVPFMLVFDKLPPDVAEYIVEPLDYTPVETAG